MVGLQWDAVAPGDHPDHHHRQVTALLALVLDQTKGDIISNHPVVGVRLVDHHRMTVGHQVNKSLTDHQAVIRTEVVVITAGTIVALITVPNQVTTRTGTEDTVLPRPSTTTVEVITVTETTTTTGTEVANTMAGIEEAVMVTETGECQITTAETVATGTVRTTGVPAVIGVASAPCRTTLVVGQGQTPRDPPSDGRRNHPEGAAEDHEGGEGVAAGDEGGGVLDNAM